MRILISGAGGLIGRELLRHLSNSGHEVFRLVRRTAQREGELEWDPQNNRLDPQFVDRMDAVINLSGAEIAGRPWTRSYVELLYSSRMQATRTLTSAMHAVDNPPAVFLSQSASGYYGEGGQNILAEDAGSGDNLLADICRQWEEAASTAPDRTRTVVSRTGVVLSPRAGALEKVLLPLRLGAGGSLGTGNQWWPWITLIDQVRAMEFLLHADCRGPVNVCAPEPATLGQLVETLGLRLNRPTKFDVPAPLLSAVMGQLASNLVLASARMEPKVLLESGFIYEHPTLMDGVDWIAGQLNGPLLVPGSR